MSSLNTLVKLNFRALLNLFATRGNTKKKGKGSGVGILILLALLALYLSGVYSFLMASSFAPAGMLSMLPAMMAVMTVVFSMTLTAFGASGIIFGSKDMDLMLSLPISSFSVMLSKVMALYLENLLICVFMMIPCGVAYIYYGGDGGVYFIAMILVLSIFLAVIPTLFAMLVGLFLAWLQTRLGGNALISNLCYLVFFIIVMVLAFRLNMLIGQNMMSQESIDRVFSTVLYPIGVYKDALLGSFGSALLFVVITAVPFVLVVYIFSMKYKALISRLSSHSNRSDYKMESLKSTGQFSALLKKELGRFWGTSIYLFNTGIGVIMAIGGSVYACFQREKMEAILGQLGSGSSLILVCLVIAFLFAMTDTASVSISLEGKTMWILKEAPIPAKNILKAKAALNVLLIAFTSAVCLPMIWFAFGFSAFEMACLLALCIGFMLFIPSFGLWLNLLFPKMDSTNDTLIVKQSMSSLIAIFGGMAVVGAGAGIYALVHKAVSDMSYILICSGVLWAAGIILFVLLFKKGQGYLLRL